jgi:multidrug efflux pump subunit AcrA (membrane-fusion protein)
MSTIPNLRCAFLAIGAWVAFSAGPAGRAAEPPPKPKKETLVSVGIAQIALMTLNDHVAAYGQVEPAPAAADQPAGGADVASPAAGIVESVHVVEGQKVKAGDLLVRMDNLTLGPVAVVAPFSGTVSRVNARMGESAEQGASLIELFDPARLVVVGNVPADDASALKLGRPVEIAANAANSKVTGKLLYISPRIDERTDSVSVRASLPPNSGFLAGQFVKLSIATAERRNVMAIPIESLVKDPDIGYVVCFLDGDMETQKPVRVGVRDGDFVEVEGEGVKVGLTVATSGAYALPKQGKVRIITPTD